MLAAGLPEPPTARVRATLTQGRAQMAVAVVALVAGLPYGLFGPGITLDDQYTLFWAEDLGTWRAAGPTQWRARPLGALLYDVQYGVIGASPLVWWAAQLAMTAATAALLVALLRRVASLPVATACTLVWVVSANHSTLDHWGAGSLAAASLLLLVGGSVLLARAAETRSPPWLAVALLTAAPLVYEATLPAALLAALALPRLLGCSDRLSRAARRVAPVAMAGGWLVAGSYHLRHDNDGWFTFADVPRALFGEGVARWSWPSAVLLGASLLGIGLVLARPVSPVVRRAVGAAPAVKAAVVPAFDRVPPGTLLVAGPPPKGHNGIFGMLGIIDPLVQLERGDDRARATVVTNAADWERVPQERRVLLP